MKLIKVLTAMSQYQQTVAVVIGVFGCIAPTIQVIYSIFIPCDYYDYDRVNDYY